MTVGDARLSFQPGVEALRAAIGRVLGAVIPKGSACALLDYPSHWNVGDSAIWTGERVALRRLGCRIVYASDIPRCSRSTLRRRLDGGGVILLQGGGNFGDLWPVHQEFREAIIREFRDVRVVVLPQTIHFRDERNQERARRALEGHRDLVVLVRDQPSLDIAERALGVQATLCPDMAFALGPLARPSMPTTSLLVLARQDIEARVRLDQALAGRARCADWKSDESWATLVVAERLTRLLARHPRLLRRLAGGVQAVWERVARERVQQGCRFLSQGRVVVTDRLHGHILASLMGIPHVVLDNSYGKVRAFYEMWSRSWPLAAWADSPEQALERATALLDE